MPITPNKNWTEGDYVAHALGERSYREGERWFNEGLPERYHVSHSSLKNWVDDKHVTNDRWLKVLVIFLPEEDPRRQMAQAILDRRTESLRRVHAHWVRSGKPQILAEEKC